MQRSNASFTTPPAIVKSVGESLNLKKGIIMTDEEGIYKTGHAYTRVATLLCTPERSVLLQLDVEEANKEMLKHGFNPVTHRIVAAYSVDVMHSLDYNATAPLDVMRCNVELVTLPFGVYDLRYNQRDGTTYFSTKMFTMAAAIENKKVSELAIDFFNSPNTKRKKKLGVLLYGPPGNGKTTDIMELSKYAEKYHYRVFVIDASYDISRLEEIRKLFLDSRTIFVLEELTERTSKSAIESLLTFLDGENSWDNSIVIATTNYPSDLPPNIVDRPGRFEVFIEYKNPNLDEITQLAELHGFSGNAENYTCLANKGLSYDYVSHIMSQALKNKISLQETLSIEMDRRKFLSATFKGKIGL